MTDVILQMSGISKSFGATRALSDMRLNIHRGEIHALMGENGAGKSTLMKILSGVYTPDSGEIRIDGQPVRLRGPASSRAVGINLIYQELSVAANLLVSENVFMGSEPRTRFGFVDRAQMTRRTDEVLRLLGAPFDATRAARTLSIAEQQQVEIARALIHDGRVLIMDEPTAALSDRETEHLFRVVRTLRDKGLAIIYISHRMAEVEALADRITVLRDGGYVGEMTRAQMDPGRIVQMMVGRPLQDFYQHTRTQEQIAGEAVLRVENLAGGKVQPATFEVHAGEIVGFAGLVGAGRTELARLVFGADARASGKVWVDGKQTSGTGPREAMRHGIAYVPEDRKKQGLFLQTSAMVNATINVADRHSRAGVVNARALERITRKAIDTLNIKVPHTQSVISSLSGGNQQKVLLARWLEIKPRVLILDEPTRGVDVGAKSEIYHIINTLAATGTAVIVISSELPEVVGLCDRVLVMREGRIAGELAKSDISQESIMTLATQSEHDAQEAHAS
jgi:ribose transport system ATP-binding protein